MNHIRAALTALAEKLEPKSGLKNATRALVWKLDKAFCEETLRKVERAKSSINLALQGDTFELAQAIKADTESIGIIGKDVVSLSQGVENLQLNEDMKRRQDILEWFSPLNFFRTQQDIFARREEGTGQWFLDTAAFQNWLAGTDRTLCCPGMPGAGKSILASVVVDFLRSTHIQQDSIGVAVIYCNFKDKDIQSSENLLASLCAQLQGVKSPLPEVLVNSYRTHKSNRTRPSWTEISQVFKDVANKLGVVYLVVDALDECSEEARNILLAHFKALPPNARLLVTTRYIKDITLQFQNGPMMDIRANPIDLERYIRSRIVKNRRLASHVRDHPTLEQDVLDRVTEKADG
ncbi:MAG: hypothetical protein Q9166_008162, partial [cf. Caloplaca sp. 2 TL-2023]